MITTKTGLNIFYSVIGADILDKTGQNAFSFGRLREEPAWWELDTNQRKHFDEVQRMNQYLREEYHQLQDYLWGSGYGRLYAGKDVHFSEKTTLTIPLARHARPEGGAWCCS